MQVGETIYLDYQAATPLDARVLRLMQDANETLFANPHATDHVLGWRAATAINSSATLIAGLFGLEGNDVIFTSGASEANAMAMRGAFTSASKTGRSEVLIGAADHSSVRNEAKNSGLTVRFIPLDSRGAPDPIALQSMITDNTAFVSVIGVNNENGAITDLGRISALCKEGSVLLHTDLSQAPLAMDINLLELDIPFATISSHKLYGPKGVGALLAGPGASDLVEPVVRGAGQQAGRRGGTLPTELIVGFAEACRLIAESGHTERRQVAELRDHFVNLLQEKQIANLIGARDLRHPGNALMHFPGRNATDLLARLQPHIAASTQSACSTGTLEPSHVLKAMGYDNKSASECVRFSFGRFSELDQVLRAVSIISDIVTSYNPDTDENINALGDASN